MVLRLTDTYIVTLDKSQVKHVMWIGPCFKSIMAKDNRNKKTNIQAKSATFLPLHANWTIITFHAHRLEKY